MELLISLKRLRSDRLNRDKGLYELITAFENTPSHCRLLIVGKLDESAPLSPALLKRLEMNPRVSCLGFQLDVRPAIMIANVLVLPSYREGFPNVLLQAGAMEKPVIASDINGCNEVIKPNFNGWLVPAKNSKELLRVMNAACMTSDKMLIKMGCSAREHIVKHFERNAYWHNLLNYYFNLKASK
jgi:glycosyltransferase involved in cell wall biosynthesis